MVLAGTSFDGVTDLYVIQNGALTVVRYRDEILDVYVRPFAGAVGENIVLMDDNARPHRTRVVNEYLEDEGIERLDWPSRSPDLNPIEHALDALQRRINARLAQPQTAQQLANALVEEFRHKKHYCSAFGHAVLKSFMRMVATYDISTDQNK